MRPEEFEDGWTVMQAMLQVPISGAAKQAYGVILAGLPDGAFAKAVRSLVSSPDWDPRTLPTVAEIREEASAITTAAKWGRPYIAGTDISLSAVLEGSAVPADDGGATPAEARAAIAQVLERAATEPRRLGRGSMGHVLALRAAEADEQARASEARKVPELTPEEWDKRRADLLKVGDALLGEGESPDAA